MKYLILIYFLTLWLPPAMGFQYQALNIQTNQLVFEDPQNTSFEISFETVLPSHSKLLIYDQELDLIKTVKLTKAAKSFSYTWDFTNQKNQPVQDGIYFYRIEHTSVNGQWDSFNQTLNSGGTNARAYWPKWHLDKSTVTFSLSNPSLVYLKGIQSNGVERLLSDWQIHPAGSPEIKLVNGPREGGFKSFDIKAIKLPDNAIMVGNPPNNVHKQAWLKHVYFFQKDVKSLKIQHLRDLLEPIEVPKFYIELINQKTLDTTTKAREIALEYKFKIDNLQSDEDSYSVFEFVDGYFISQKKLKQPELKTIIKAQRLLRGDHQYKTILVKGTRILDIHTLDFRLE